MAIKLKAIGELLDKKFFIPSYQRGYKWSEREVLDLLEDIQEFIRKKDKNLLKKGEFYCLQPIVVKYDKEKGYKVIDGQQRLTTIFILLKYLEEVRKFFDKQKTIYEIEYETRNESKKFLNQINEIEEINEKNIDFYYMSNAYLTIKKWFEKTQANELDFLKILLSTDIENEIDNANNVRIIWYEIEDENEIDVFTRLNIGKIPLTNAELIKAMFLLDKTKQKTNDKIMLATEWDNIEYTLQNDTFFAFINGKFNEYKKPTRIEFIFDLIASKTKLKIENLKEDDEKYSYYIFDRLLNNEEFFEKEFGFRKSFDKRVEFLWDEIKTYFRIFEELYSKNEYYHLVGYLINYDNKINDIIENYKNKPKKEFQAYLENEIKNKLNITSAELSKLEYGKNSKQIENILFLFNVILTKESKYSKYPFDLHKKQQWSLEHIHAQNSEEIKKDKDRKLLLENQKEYIDDKDLKQRIDKLLESKKIDDEEFNKIQDEIFRLFSDDINIHTIDNLALLSKKDNSSLNNSIFPSKRDLIIKLDSKGSFIPIGTKNVFLKYFSDNVKEVIKWEKRDRENYLKKIKDTLENYLKGNNND